MHPVHSDSIDAGAPRRRRRALHLAAALTLLAVAACDDASADGDARAEDGPGPASAAVQATDATGRTVRLPGPARRVVSMLPSVTEWIIALGAADRIVARTDFDHHPALDTLPSIGGGLDPSVEWLAARRPDLVVAWPDAPSRSVVSRLEQVGIPVYAARTQTIDDALGVAADLGALLGLPRAADSAVAVVRYGLDSVGAGVAGLPRPDVLFVIGLDPVMAAGPGTFIDELVVRAGGRNVLEDVGVQWPTLSLEEVVRRAPDVVLVGSASVDDPAAVLEDRPGWRDVPAVRAGAVHAVDPDFVNRPGPRLHEAAGLLARLIHR